MSKTVAHKAFPPLKGEQAAASHPDSSDVWLSASAGTGKTQVLTARVLRLLLHDARPESILCLTFTKAGAAEMANRINEILGAWVRLPSNMLFKDLEALGEESGPVARAKARMLFAKVLDARGGGLRIQTIHSFCQSLLGGFPAEASLIPGFRAIEGREEAALAQSVLAELVADAERTGQLGLIERLQQLSYRMGEDAARLLLGRCARDPDAMEALEAGIDARVRRWLGLGDADPEALLLAACTDGGFDGLALERLRDMNLAWGSARGLEKVEAIADWLAMTPVGRRDHIDVIASVWARADGEIRSFAKGQAPQDDGYAELAEAQYAFFNGLLQLRVLARTAEAIANALTVGQAYARAYADAKRASGLVDFNDLIRHTVKLLETDGMGDWIRYKLDQATDHVLVDEAQDTNARQWDIVKAIAGEFYAGEGAKAGTVRTLFTVGDYKQAIFGFQGTNPKEFERAKAHFSDLAANAEREVLDLSLVQSFRSGRPVLDVVNQLIETISPAAMGLQTPPRAHVSARAGQSGSVTLWAPVEPGLPDAEDVEAEESWLADSELKFASDLAERVWDWTRGPNRLRLRNEARDAEPGDVLILVRKRGDLARTIVSRLYEANVPVAGVDRLTLNAPIAVQDLLSCIRFVLQPDDDLNLAALLVSPLLVWSQSDLYDRGKQRTGLSLWQHLGEQKPQALLDLLGAADLTTPHRFLEAILSGPMQGRRKLLARLGDEARDPIEELINQALAFEREAPPSLQGFIDWFDRGAVEIKRDSAQSGGAVRVMTVHGAKGLQAPIVVLADATSDPDFRVSRDLDWAAEDKLSLPIFRPRKEELSGSLKASAEASDARETEENWRLLYVALTRAEEHLFVGGALKPRQHKSGMGENCWHVQVDRAMAAMGVAEIEGTRTLVHHEGEPKPSGFAGREAAPEAVLPDWLRTPAPQEARPPRPLAPSTILPADTVADPPPSPGMRQAAERGSLLHSLFERLPAVETTRRVESAERWLRDSAGVGDAETRRALVADALRVLEEPAFATIFAPDALAEAPLAGVVDGQVIAGTVDRLLVSDSKVLVVDFKTGRRVPASADAAFPHHKAQMAAYVAVLRGIFPDHDVRAALLYTSGPKLIHLSDADLEPHKPGFHDQQDNLATAG
jgi:ATP-dependent helicase/nuclease subunit A